VPDDAALVDALERMAPDARRCASNCWSQSRSTFYRFAP
jgi:hypothetical protein